MTTALLNPLSDVALRVLGRSGAILCYHGLTPTAQSAAGTLHVSRQRFADTLQALRDQYTIVPLTEMLERHRDGRSTAALLALTFDDAYLSVGEAVEALAAAAAPITLFPVGDALDDGRRFWWDRIDDAFDAASPDQWRQFEDRCGLPEAFRRGQPAEYGPLRPFRQWMLATYQGRWPATLSPALDDLERQVGGGTGQRSMTVAEITALTQRVPTQIGVHTATHPVLPLLPDDEVRREIQSGFERIRGSFASAVPILAVPFGLGDARVVRLAAEAGMVTSLSLGGTTLRRDPRADWMPRICLSPGLPIWRLKLALTGALDRHDAARRFPDLPSATT